MSVKVKFISEVEVKDGKKTLKAAKNAHIKIGNSCEGNGKCGKCVIKVLSGKLSEPTKKELKVLGQEKIDNGYRLSCQTQILEDSVIEIINDNEIKVKKDNVDNK
jgi:ferredoxin